MIANRVRITALVAALCAALVFLVSCGKAKPEAAKAKATKAKATSSAKGTTEAKAKATSKTTAPTQQAIGTGGRWTIEDGASRRMKIGPGRYRVDLRASGDRVRIEWIGGDQPSSGEVAQYTKTVAFSSAGEMVISNPKALGYGGTSTVAVTVARVTR